MTVDPLIIITVFVAAFVQGVSGFGFALVAMPILSGMMSLSVVVPLVALSTLANNTIMGLYYRQSCDRSAVMTLLIGAVLGVPLGFWVLQAVPVPWMLTSLGLMIVIYALYAWLGPELPELGTKWSYGAGFVSGVLMGSYNLPGPPVVLYGNSQRWPQDQFKGNLTRFFWFNAAVAVVGHGIQHRLSGSLINQFLITLPGLVVGLFAGILLAKLFNPVIFRRVVLGVLMIVGVRLMVLGILHY